MPAGAKAAVWAACVIVALPAVWAAFLTYYGGFLVIFLLAFTGLTLTIGTTADKTPQAEPGSAATPAASASAWPAA